MLTIAALCKGQLSLAGDIDLLGAPVISIVDDDTYTRDAIGDLLQSLGYRAVTFPSAEEFLDSGHVGEVACLITDLQMPGMNGLDLQSQLLAAGYDTPVIFISAFPDERVRTRALNAGAFAFLSKPFLQATLIGCIDAVLDRSQHK